MTTIKEHPTLFRPEMVRAILAGRKTQTRRIVTERNSTVCGEAGQAFWHLLDWSRVHVDLNEGGRGLDVAGNQYLHVGAPDNCQYRVRSRFGTGERLWVKERLIYRDGLRYFADDAPVTNIPDHAKAITRKGLPSIFMPRWASRITLGITGVRVERVQGISDEDALAEGVAHSHGACNAERPVNSFADLWVGINGAESWDANPWVWVISFKRVGG